MPDAEVFKLILNGGSFGLLAIIVVWMLFWGSPMLRDALEKMTADHRATVDAVVKACKEEQRSTLAWIATQFRRGQMPRPPSTDHHTPLE